MGGPSPAEWEDALGALTIGREPSNALERELAADPGVAILRKLASEARAGMVVEALSLTSRLLSLTVGRDGLRALLEEFWPRVPPERFASSEAESFARFVAERVPESEVPYLEDVLAFERSLLRARVEQAPSVVRFRHSPAPLLEALNEGRLPEALPREDYTVTLEPVAGDPARVSVAAVASASRA
jgi:hypothetical protein